MQTRYCFNPSDPTLRRYVLTKALMEENFVECPPPGNEIPPTLLGGAGGVLDQTATAMALAISKQLGPEATEAQVQAFANAISRLDPENLAALAEPVQKQPAITTPAPAPAPTAPSAMASAMDATPVAAPAAASTTEPTKETGGILEMCDIPMVDVAETADSAVQRFFDGKRMADVTKLDIMSYSLKTMKVKLDQGKTKPLLIRDLQLVELALQNQEG